jgi:hypothetical protein
MGLLDQCEVFFGQTDAIGSRLYARVRDVDPSRGLELAGTVRGPFCARATTLPSRVPLAACPPGPSLLATAWVPDPCFWSPALPAWYDVQLQLRRGGQLVQQASWQLGIRQLGVRGRDLFLEGHRWVLRGVDRRRAIGGMLDEWRDLSAALLLVEFDEQLARDASQSGVMLLVTVDAPPELLESRLRQISRHAAAAIVVLENDPPTPQSPRQAAPNLLLAARIATESAPVPAWADLAIVACGPATDLAESLRICDVPVLAQRPLPQALPLAAARAACDRLQRDLADAGDLAGYIV